MNHREDHHDCTPPSPHPDRRAPGLLRRLLGHNARHAAKVQSFRRLAMRLEHDLSGVEGGRRLMLIPVDSPEDAARPAMELARIFSGELNRRVLLVDASFSEGALSRKLGHADEPGLVDLLRGDTDDAPHVPTGRDGIWLLPKGNATTGRSVPIIQAQLRSILDRATSGYDYALIATDSTRADSRCLAFPGVVDHVLLFALEGRTLLDDLDASRRSIEHCSRTRVGVVLTRPTHFPVRW